MREEPVDPEQRRVQAAAEGGREAVSVGCESVGVGGVRVSPAHNVCWPRF